MQIQETWYKQFTNVQANTILSDTTVICILGSLVMSKSRPAARLQTLWYTVHPHSSTAHCIGHDKGKLQKPLCTVWWTGMYLFVICNKYQSSDIMLMPINVCASCMQLYTLEA